MDALWEALSLLFGGDHDTLWTIGATLRFSLFSTAISALLGVPLGAFLTLGRFRGRRVVIALVNASMAVPTVVVGLIVYALVSRTGPLGAWDLLYAPGGVVLGQSFLAFPLVTAMTFTGLQKLDPRYHETLLTLGASRGRRLLAVLREGRRIVLQAVLAGFGRVTGEVGVAMMIGGNIRLHTRTMTTAIALQANQGEFERALALGIVVLAIALAVNFLSHVVVREP